MVHTYIFSITVILLAFAHPAMAYIDPGAGSMILQVLLAGILGALFAIKMFWRNVKAFFTTLFSRKNQTGKDAD